MARSIQASVGLGGANRADDVYTVQSLLNDVPAGGGGPLAPLDTDGKCGPLTVGAILRFQQTQFHWADGRVDAGGQTIGRLGEFDAGTGPATPPVPGGIDPPQIVTPPGHVPPAPPPPPSSSVPIPAGLPALRRRVLEVALGEALPATAVSDLITRQEDGLLVRAGWRRLKQYFDEGVDGWNENKWKDKSTLDGVRIPGRRIPQPGTSGVSWCGIFATWAVRTAGVETKWRMGLGPSRLALKFSRDCRPGDICVMKEHIHHFIVASIDGDNMVTVNGNSENQAILVKNRPLSCVRYFYSVD